MSLSIGRAQLRGAHDIAAVAGELLHEIMEAIGAPFFTFGPGQTTARVKTLLARGRYIVSRARGTGDRRGAGFVSLYESYALFAEGVSATIGGPYVRAAYRAAGPGTRLLEAAVPCSANECTMQRSRRSPLFPGVRGERGTACRSVCMKGEENGK